MGGGGLGEGNEGGDGLGGGEEGGGVVCVEGGCEGVRGDVEDVGFGAGPLDGCKSFKFVNQKSPFTYTFDNFVRGIALMELEILDFCNSPL